MTVFERIRWQIASRLNLDRHIDLIESSQLFDVAYYSRVSGRSWKAPPDAIRDYLRKGHRRGTNPNPLFDRAWYRRRYVDVARGGVDSLVHYILHGAAELRDPHPLFLAEHYAATIGNRLDTSNPLRCFLHEDDDPTRSPHPLFLGSYYKENNPDLATFDRPVIFHFLEHGGFEIRAFHPLFDVKYYQRFAGRNAERNVLVDYLTGPRTARTYYFFDPEFYLRTNPDVARTSILPLVHYVLRGSRERRAPHSIFDQGWYLARYPEALLAPESALGHFARVGQARGHQPNRYFDSDWYAATHAARLNGLSPVEHYVTAGLEQNLQPSPAFDPAYYLESNPDIAATNYAAFAHFMQHGRLERRRALDPKSQAGAGRFAVVLHLFYLDLLPEIEDYLRPLEGTIDIIVTVPETTEALFTSVVKGALPTARVVPVANRGRDIGALFELAKKVDLSGYTAVCKLHTKKGITERDVWRHMMLYCLVGNRTIVDMITDGFRFNSDLWFVGPADFHISTRRFIGPNARGVLGLFAEMYPHSWPDFDWGFFAGTMFWFRPAAIDRLEAALDKRGAFDEETLVNDGTVMHSIERVFLLPAAIEGKLIGRLAFPVDEAVPELLISPSAEGISNEEPADTLAQFARPLDGKIRCSIPPPTRAFTTPAEDRGIDPSVNLIGPLVFLNGLGTSVRAYLSLLQDIGVTVNAVCWERGFERLSRTEIALPTTEEPAATNIVHINLDLLAAGDFLNTGGLAELMSKARRNILVFYWELPTLKPEWVALVRRFDEVWCPTSFIRQMVQAVCDVPTRLLRPDLGVATQRRTAEADRPFIGLPDDRFVFAYFADGGSIMKRKNPDTLVRAFVEEFDEDEGACCYIKIHYPEEAEAELGRLRAIVGGRKDVILAGELYDDDEMQILFESIDCYVSPHRSEGLGLTIIEAMRNTKPVIATPYGGAADFVDDARAYPLEFTLVEVGPGCEPYPDNFVWADPSLDSLRRQMRAVFANRSEAARKAQAAREAVFRVMAENRETARAAFTRTKDRPDSKDEPAPAKRRSALAPLADVGHGAPVL